jgi:hypothetical protein
MGAVSVEMSVDLSNRSTAASICLGIPDRPGDEFEPDKPLRAPKINDFLSHWVPERPLFGNINAL